MGFIGVLFVMVVVGARLFLFILRERERQQVAAMARFLEPNPFIIQPPLVAPKAFSHGFVRVSSADGEREEALPTSVGRGEHPTAIASCPGFGIVAVATLISAGGPDGSAVYWRGGDGWKQVWRAPFGLSSIASDADGTVYFGAIGGYVCYHKGEWQMVKLNQGTPYSVVGQGDNVFAVSSTGNDCAELHGVEHSERTPHHVPPHDNKRVEVDGVTLTLGLRTPDGIALVA